MKKWFIILLTLVIFTSPIILGGCSMLNGTSEKEEMMEIVESRKMKRAIEAFLKKLEPQALTSEGKIQSYKILKDKLKYNPMGGMVLEVVINGDEKLNIDMTVQEEESGEYRVAAYGVPQELSKLLREE